MARPADAGRALVSRPTPGRLAVGRDSSPFRRNDGEPRLPILAVALAGLLALIAGLFVFSPAALPFSLGGAFDGLLAQLPTTFSAGLSISLATAMEVAAGSVLVRLVRWSPYGSIGEAIVAGVIGAVAKDTVLLLALGSIGHFQPLVLAVTDVLLIGGGLLLRPFMVSGPTAARSWSGIGWILPVVIWAIPVIIQLSSPVAPFADGVANHVAPIEHVRTYHSYGSLVVSPSPMFGPAAISLGYVSFVGSVVSLTGLPASLGVAAFALPLAVLLAAGGYYVTRSLAGPRAGSWALLTVPLTFAFLRLPDASAVVLALPLGAATVMLSLGASRFPDPGAVLTGRSQPTLVAAALGATFLVHPIIALFAAATVLLLLVVRPSTMRRAVIAGLIGGGIVALPQFAGMAGVVAPAWVAVPAWPAGLLAAAWLGGPGPRRGDLAETLPPARSFGIILMFFGVVALIAAIGLAVAAVLSLDPQLPDQLLDHAAWALTNYPVLIAGLVLAAVLVRVGLAWLVIVAALVAALVIVVLAGFVPTDTSLGQALASELPEAASYWVPWLIALAGGIGLGEAWSREAWPTLARVGIAATIVFAAAFPYRTVTSLPAPDQEHTYTESMAIALRVAESGYWQGYPDPRTLVAASGTALLEAVRAEQDAGRLGPSDGLLHITPSFQQWLATPLGVLTGTIETDATRDPASDIPSEDSRIFDQLKVGDLLGPAYPYVVIEGYTTEAGFDQRAADAGYQPVATGDGWRMLRLPASR